MGDIRRITDWRVAAPIGALYEQLLGALGTETFGATVRSCVLSLTAGARRIYLFEATARDNTALQYFSGEPGLVDLFPAYRRWYLPQDPVGDAFGAARVHGDVALQRVRPADIASTGFRRRFFDDAGIVERISIVQRGADAWRGINVARHAREGYCSDIELTTLVGLAFLVLPMLPQNRLRKAPATRLTAEELERRFGHLCERLTRREREVCARAALGMSVEATALELGIAKTSVVTYRQRAYQRLQIGSPLELRSLVTH